MAASEWIPTVAERDLPDGVLLAVYPKGLGVLLARVDGDLYAVANRCYHMGCPLEAGRLRGTILTCPCHDWRFDIRDGRFVTAPELRIRTFHTMVEDGKIHVSLKGA